MYESLRQNGQREKKKEERKRRKKKNRNTEIERQKRKKKKRNVRSFFPFFSSFFPHPYRRVDELLRLLSTKKIEAEIADDAGKAASGEENAGEEGEITSKN